MKIIVPDVSIVASIFENANSLNRAVEKFRGSKQKEKFKAPVSEATRKCSGSRNQTVMQTSATFGI